MFLYNLADSLPRPSTNGAELVAFNDCRRRDSTTTGGKDLGLGSNVLDLIDLVKLLGLTAEVIIVTVIPVVPIVSVIVITIVVPVVVIPIIIPVIVITIVVPIIVIPVIVVPVITIVVVPVVITIKVLLVLSLLVLLLLVLLLLVQLVLLILNSRLGGKDAFCGARGLKLVGGGGGKGRFGLLVVVERLGDRLGHVSTDDGADDLVAVAVAVISVPVTVLVSVAVPVSSVAATAPAPAIAEDGLAVGEALALLVGDTHIVQAREEDVLARRNVTLDETGIEASDPLELVEEVDTNEQRLDQDQEDHTLCARGGGQAAGVSERRQRGDGAGEEAKVHAAEADLLTGAANASGLRNNTLDIGEAAAVGELEEHDDDGDLRRVA